MRKILFVLFAALAFVACQKEESMKGTPGIVVYYDNNIKYPNLDVVSGDKTRFTTSDDAYVSDVYLYNEEAEEPIIFKFQNGSEKCNFDIGEIKMLDKTHFEITISPTPDCQYDAIGVFMADAQERGYYSKGAFLGFFER